MNKFGRNYILSIQTQSGQILTIQPPFTMEFDITRNILSSANVCSIRVYNLSLNNRNQIRFNTQDNVVTNSPDQKNFSFRSVVLQAGYGTTNLPVIFSGNITQAWSVREGVNFITSIECFDGGFAFANGQTTLSAPAGESLSNIIETMASSLPYVTVGAIGTEATAGTLPRGNAYAGNTTDLLRQLTGNAFFIDNGQVHILGDGEYIDDGTPVVVNASAGLLSTPLRETTNFHFDMLLTPEIKPGRLISLQSLTDPTFNGLKKVNGVKHRGVISGAVCGDAITTVQCFYEQSYSPVQLL